MESKKQYIALMLMIGGLLAGLLVGCVAKGLMILEPETRFLILSGILVFGVGAGFLTSVFRAEREHELKIAAYFADDFNRTDDSLSSSGHLPSLRLVK